MIRKIGKFFLKINILRFIIQTLQYKIRIGNYVNFSNNGVIKFNSRNISIRDFSEIVVREGGILEINDDVFLGKDVEIGADNIFIDNHTSIQNNCIILGNVTIGRNCILASAIYISSGHHYFKHRPSLLIRDQDIIAKNELNLTQNQIIIEDDVWIGKGVVIINNAIIGKGSVLGANSVINKSVEPYSIVVGAPQKVIGRRLNFFDDMPCELIGNCESHFPYFYKGVDYSITSMNTNKLVSICSLEFVLCLKNNNRLSCLVIEFMAPVTSIEIQFETQVIHLTNEIRVKINDLESHRHKFKINNLVPGILIKRAFYE
jgi:acetyltransferase-like isoleucine patch superfamily enzyme